MFSVGVHTEVGRMIPHESDVNGGFNNFVEKLFDQSSTLPWLLKYEERRQVSNEERIKRQVGLELQWANRPVKMLWSQLSLFALPSKDYKMLDKDFLAFLAACGISHLIQERIFEVVRLLSGGVLDGFVFCKAIDLALENPATCDPIVQHCFKSLPLPCDRGEEVLRLKDIDRALTLLDRTAKAKERRKGLKKTKLPQKNVLVSVRRKQLVAVKALFTSEEQELSYENFKHIFFNDDGVLGSAFVKQIIEACAKYFHEPFGRYPSIPLRWLNTITPLPFADTPADADSLLLQDVEYTGIDPNSKKKKWKRRN